MATTEAGDAHSAKRLTTVSRSPVCFLNLDGVTHAVGTYYLPGHGEPPYRPFCWVNGLEELAARWDLRFVLWTSATSVLGLERVRELAPSWLKERIQGETPAKLVYLTLSDIRKLRSSYASLSYYLAQHPIDNWVAVADDTDGWPDTSELRERLVVCDGTRGLSDPSTLSHIEAVLQKGSQ